MLSIIVLSSDGYSDCWAPLFGQFEKYFKEIKEFELILSTNTKDFDSDIFDIKVIKSGLNTPWSKRLKISLLEAQGDLVFVMVEDFVLRSKIDFKLFKTLLNYFDEYSGIDHIRLLTSLIRTKSKKSQFKFLDEIERTSNLRFAYLPGLWRKKTLLKYAKEFETPYMSERIGDYRSYIYKDGFYALSNEYIMNNGQFYDCETSGAIYKGKWSEWVKNFALNENIDIDFSKRGFVTDEYRLQTRKNSRKVLINAPFSTIRSVLSVILLFFQTRLKKTK